MISSDITNFTALIWEFCELLVGIWMVSINKRNVGSWLLMIGSCFGVIVVVFIIFNNHFQLYHLTGFNPVWIKLVNSVNILGIIGTTMTLIGFLWIVLSVYQLHRKLSKGGTDGK